MEIWLLGAAIILASISFYRKFARWRTTPKMRVREMLWRYRSLEKKGLSEQDCLLQLLATRNDWKRLPQRFLVEIAARLSTKEDVMRFVSVSEDYRYQIDHYPRLAAKIDLDAAMGGAACLLARFGFQLQEQGRYKEAEFVQKLALQLQPDQYFTNLPLAANYHETGRHADALPLFERGLAKVEEFERGEGPAATDFSPENCLGADV
ncbi:MAG: tetratricopeptide repeat protein, partial [Candidatus Binatia bacterium]|nr:tetratricopeptide repeat protein [Candidatus Binatia bacterium]